VVLAAVQPAHYATAGLAPRRACSEFRQTGNRMSSGLRCRWRAGLLLRGQLDARHEQQVAAGVHRTCTSPEPSGLADQRVRCSDVSRSSAGTVPGWRTRSCRTGTRGPFPAPVGAPAGVQPAHDTASSDRAPRQPVAYSGQTGNSTSSGRAPSRTASLPPRSARRATQQVVVFAC